MPLSGQLGPDYVELVLPASWAYVGPVLGFRLAVARRPCDLSSLACTVLMLFEPSRAIFLFSAPYCLCLVFM